jgi:protein-disulfide isomerase
MSFRLASPLKIALPLAAALAVAALVVLAAGAGDPDSARSASAAAETDAEVVATIHGEPVTREDLMEVAAPQLQKLRQQEYEILQTALNNLINDRLIKAAAEKEGLTPEEYFEKRVNEKLAEPSEEDLQALYEQYKGHPQLQGKSLEEVRPTLVEAVRAQQAQELFGEILEGLRTAASVEVRLDAPRVKVAADDDPTRGPEDAPVTIVTFSDYQCPYCQRAETTVNRVLEKYGEKVRLVFRDFPLSFHQQAQKAHEAAGCADEQGKFWAMHEKLFENTSALQVDDLIRYAGEVGLDQEQFRQCLESGQRAAEVAADMQAGQRAGVSGTPAFFVNGRMISGAVPYEDFVAVIDEELERAN